MWNQQNLERIKKNCIINKVFIHIFLGKEPDQKTRTDKVQCHLGQQYICIEYDNMRFSCEEDAK